jgi:DNA-binding MurR/RpiR family transcriptional regulator
MAAHSLHNRIVLLERLSASEAKLAEFFEYTYPLIALESLTSISTKVGVSKATVVRFISKLGYESFLDFQKQVQKELIDQLDSPFARSSGKKRMPDHPSSDLVENATALAQRSILQFRRRIKTEDLLRAARLIAGCEGTVYMVGAGASHALAHLLWVNALYLKDRVVLIKDLEFSLPHQLVSVGRKDVLVAVSCRRYSLQTYQVTAWFRQQGAAIILVTDRELTPFAGMPDIQFAIPPVGSSMFDSNYARLMVIETLIAAIEAQLNHEIRKRESTCEKVFKSFSTFIPSSENNRRKKNATIVNTE